MDLFAIYQSDTQASFSYSVSSGQQRQKPRLPLLLLRATRLHLIPLLRWLGSCELMIVTQSDACTAEPVISRAVIINLTITITKAC